MNFRKLSLLILFFSLLGFYSCGDDENSNLEGRWQLNQIETSDGKKQDVDTIFYSFDRNVFQYLKLTSDTETFMGFGNYSVSGGEIKVDLIWDSFRPYECDTCLGWNNLSRNFIIKKNTSSALILESEEEILYFKKY
ncbi:lipocalin-like protein [Dysgonomonas alginatilytica]|uniref:Lipocalin-like protein n=1 Tax=Dysgonomonas alginatilytica TaxID=1605892 RepID=A0A2V3PNG5_9BACT|nr:lipocalin-like domain-containing protein [Dysgonomonas alginatilytica]PXV63855.1 lipocalin-like protein [Dysgonomonas alginatilytica]